MHLLKGSRARCQFDANFNKFYITKGQTNGISERPITAIRFLKLLNILQDGLMITRINANVFKWIYQKALDPILNPLLT